MIRETNETQFDLQGKPALIYCLETMKGKPEQYTSINEICEYMFPKNTKTHRHIVT